MTAKELIEVLKKFPDHLDVRYIDHECGDTLDINGAGLEKEALEEYICLY